MPWRHGPRFLTRPSLVILLDPHSLLPILLPLLSYRSTSLLLDFFASTLLTMRLEVAAGFGRRAFAV